MGARWLSLGVFVLVCLAVNLWSGRRDRAAGTTFSVRGPAEFERQNKQEAAEMLLGDEDSAKGAGTGSLFLRYGKDDEDKRYTEVLQVDEDDYAVRTGEDDRKDHFNRGVIEIDGHSLKILDSKIVELGGNEVIVGRLETEIDSDGGKLKVRLIRYILPSDRGRAVVDGYCLASEESIYRPKFDASVAAARGVALRPGKLPWYYVSAIGGAAALLTELALRWRVRGRNAKAAPATNDPPVPDEAADDAPAKPATKPKKSYKAKKRDEEAPSDDES